MLQKKWWFKLVIWLMLLSMLLSTVAFALNFILV
ncbi:stressosome-associated protein Prli42 [Paenibacillus turpanensis]|nr:stressosome-associated protein Prli42 [Paenibacillus turpanensis]